MGRNQCRLRRQSNFRLGAAGVNSLMQTSAGTATEPQAAAAAMFRNRLSVRMMVARDYWSRGRISRVAGAPSRGWGTTTRWMVKLAANLPAGGVMLSEEGRDMGNGTGRKLEISILAREAIPILGRLGRRLRPFRTQGDVGYGHSDRDCKRSP